MAAALRLLNYFNDPKTVIERYFAGREKGLKLATSEESWRAIVERKIKRCWRVAHRRGQQDQNRHLARRPRLRKDPGDRASYCLPSAGTAGTRDASSRSPSTDMQLTRSSSASPWWA